MKSYDKRLLASNDGHIVLTRDWAKSLLCRLGFVKRQGSTAAKLTVTNFDEIEEGEFLSPQLIYQGTTKRCLPSMKFPAGWYVTYSANHWSNETTMMKYVKEILLPYLANKRSCQQLQPDYPALVIFNNFKAQIAEGVIRLFEDNNVQVAMVPPNRTDRLQ